MDVTVYEGIIRRDLSNTDLFSDLFATPEYTGYYTDDIGYVLQFNGDLTADQIELVRLRVHTTPEIESFHRILISLQDDINSVQTTPAPLGPNEATEAIKLLANAVDALYQLRQADL